MEVVNHSKIGASGAHRFWECEGCVALSEKAKRDGLVKETSKFAKEGTAAHLLAEMCFENKAIADEYVGNMIEVEDDIITVTQEMADAVQIYLDAVDAVVSRYPTKTWGFEKEFKLDDVDSEAYGTNDAFLYIPSKKKLVIWDYKHGKGQTVEVKGNKQLLYYALGALACIQGVVETIKIVIVQPRKEHKDGAVRSHTYTIGELLDFKMQLIEKIKATRKPIVELKSGKWCKFCPAILICEIAEKQTWRQNTTYSVAQAIEDFS